MIGVVERVTFKDGGVPHSKYRPEMDLSERLTESLTVCGLQSLGYTQDLPPVLFSFLIPHPSLSFTLSYRTVQPKGH